jgi:hypothetical protein
MALMNSRHLVVVCGVFVAVISVIADVIGIGGEPGFGYKQGAGFLVGIALIIGGAWWKHRQP